MIVESMLQMHGQLHEDDALSPQERKVLKRRNAELDRRIDQLVYDLYGLTDDEIRIVEKATESSA